MPIPLANAQLVAAIGSGGKTTALGLLAESHRHQRVLLTTTTHIQPFPHCTVLENPSAQDLSAALGVPGVVCAGSRESGGKFSALPPAVFKAGQLAAQLVLYEADGSRGLPLKLHRSFEPVLLPETDLCIVVVGLSALGQPVSECVHCYDLCPDWAQAPQHRITPQDVLTCINDAIVAGGLPQDRYHILLNQADSPTQYQAAMALQSQLRQQGFPCTIRSRDTEKKTV